MGTPILPHAATSREAILRPHGPTSVQAVQGAAGSTVPQEADKTDACRCYAGRAARNQTVTVVPLPTALST